MAQQVNEWLIALAVDFIRPLSLSLLLPLLKSGSLGAALLRNGVLMSLTFPILPIIYQQKIMMHIGKDYSWLGLVTGEVIIGFLIGFCAAVPFWAVDMAGFLLDTLRGATMGTIFNSTMEAETSLFGLLFSQFLCVIFFISGGMEFILNILYESYQYLPPGRTLLFDRQFFKIYPGRVENALSIMCQFLCSCHNMYGISRSGFRSFKSVGTTTECVFLLNAAQKYISSTHAPDLIPLCSSSLFG